MRLVDLLRFTLLALRRQRFRSGMLLLAVGLGVAAVVVLTDGADSGSRTKYGNMLREIKLSDDQPIRVFPIAYAKGASLKVLEAIADATQTKAYSGDPRNIDKVFKDISTFF